jgi:hypothetical protein
MSDQRNCRVIGLKDDGEQVIVSGYISREEAEQLIALIADNADFSRLTIECDDER